MLENVVKTYRAGSSGSIRAVDQVSLLVHRVGVLPWRMSAEEYLDHPARLPLTGGHVEALWDPELAPAMRHRGLAVHEEAVLPELLHGLASSPEGVGR